MAKIRIDSGLYERAKAAAEKAGYSSVEEFVAHVIETEVAKHESADSDKKTAEQLRGLGYIQ